MITDPTRGRKIYDDLYIYSIVTFWIEESEKEKK